MTDIRGAMRSKGAKGERWAAKEPWADSSYFVTCNKYSRFADEEKKKTEVFSMESLKTTLDYLEFLTKSKKETSL